MNPRDRFAVAIADTRAAFDEVAELLAALQLIRSLYSAADPIEMHVRLLREASSLARAILTKWEA